jgi:hypothetical protein
MRNNPENASSSKRYRSQNYLKDKFCSGAHAQTPARTANAFPVIDRSQKTEDNHGKHRQDKRLSDLFCTPNKEAAFKRTVIE